MEEQTNEQVEELEKLDLFVWGNADLEKPIEQSPRFDYMKSIGDNFKKIQEKDVKFNAVINSKVSAEKGKGLSANDFTNEYKTKLDGLENYDDTEAKKDIADIKSEQKIQNINIENLQNDKVNKTELEQKYGELQQENKYLKELNDSLQETVLDSETEVAETLIVEDATAGIGKINVFGGSRQGKKSIENGDEYDSPSVQYPVQIECIENSVEITVRNEDSSKSGNYIMLIQQKMLENDCFEKINGNWYEKHNWIELVLDTDKLRRQNTNTTDKYRYAYELAEKVLQTDNQHARGYCTHFPTTNNAGTFMRNKGFAVSQSGAKMNIWIYDEGETLEEFKAKIANEEVKFYLQLEEAQYIKCTDEQCKILDKIDTYKDCTIITTDNGLCKISLKYKQDLNKRIAELEDKINL